MAIGRLRKLSLIFRRAVIALSLAWFSLVCVVGQEELPTDRLLRSLQPTADVNDFAGIITPAEKQSLEERCRNLREKTGAQLAVVIVKSLEGGQIDDFAVKLFKRWGIGQKDQKNGILLFVAIQDRKARIEVGYGLEPILPDALAGRVLNEQLFPAFKQQRYADGLTAAVDRIALIIEKNEPAPANIQARRDQGNKLMVVSVLSLFVAAGSYIVGTGLAKPVGPLVPFGSLFIAIPFLIGLGVAFPWAPIVHVPVGLALGWLGWQAGRDNHRGPGQRSGRGWNWTGPAVSTWDWGNSAGTSGWSGGGFSGGSSDWGGFGGGSSGGGGASGGW
jgi:uncharacterized protein